MFMGLGTAEKDPLVWLECLLLCGCPIKRQELCPTCF